MFSPLGELSGAVLDENARTLRRHHPVDLNTDNSTGIPPTWHHLE